MFINAIQIFLTGGMSQDELSNIANHLWYSREKRSDELGSVLYKCSELSFYIRRIYIPERPDNNGNFIWFMKATMEYYEKKQKFIKSDKEFKP